MVRYILLVCALLIGVCTTTTEAADVTICTPYNGSAMHAYYRNGILSVNFPEQAYVGASRSCPKGMIAVPNAFLQGKEGSLVTAEQNLLPKGNGLWELVRVNSYYGYRVDSQEKLSFVYEANEYLHALLTLDAFVGQYNVGNTPSMIKIPAFPKLYVRIPGASKLPSDIFGQEAGVSYVNPHPTMVVATTSTPAQHIVVEKKTTTANVMSQQVVAYTSTTEKLKQTIAGLREKITQLEGEKNQASQEHKNSLHTATNETLRTSALLEKAEEKTAELITANGELAAVNGQLTQDVESLQGQLVVLGKAKLGLPLEYKIAGGAIVVLLLLAGGYAYILRKTVQEQKNTIRKNREVIARSEAEGRKDEEIKNHLARFPVPENLECPPLVDPENGFYGDCFYTVKRPSGSVAFLDNLQEELNIKNVINAYRKRARKAAGFIDETEAELFKNVADTLNGIKEGNVTISDAPPVIARDAKNGTPEKKRIHYGVVGV